MSELIIVQPNNQSSRARFFERYIAEKEEEYGFSLNTYKRVEKFIRFLYRDWFKVQIAGLHNVPGNGNVILFGNHSGVLPVDGCLFYDGIINNHPEPRRVRFLVTKFLLDMPLVGPCLKGFGAIPADYETAKTLLSREEIVFFYPEAEKGTGKLFKNRYKLVDFHSGFIRAAIETGSPLVPIVTIGGDEIYPLLANIKPLAKVINAPYFPITPFFPWLPFPIWFVPLPVRIMACVWPTIRLKYPPEAAEDADLITEIANDMQRDIQAKVNDLLKIRKSPFKDWDMQKVQAYLDSTGTCCPSLDKHLLREESLD